MQIFPSDLFSRSRLAAELLGLAVSRLFPDVLLIGGGVHALGFFYDFIFKQPLLDSLIFLIEGELKALIKEAIPLRWLSMMRENAQTLFDYHHQPLLANRIGEEPSNIVELIQVQNFYGICAPLPLSSTQEAGHIKLLHYLKLPEKGERGIRLIGVNQPTVKDLKIFLKNYDLLLKRKDHRKLGPQLNLFHFSDPDDSLGVFWHPKGMKLQQILRNWIEKPFGNETLAISTPLVQQVASSKDEESFSSFLFEGQRYQLRASPLRGHMEELEKEILSGSPFPLRFMEEALSYQPVLETQRWGLLSSCHQVIIQRTIGCLREQSISELISSLHFIEEIIKIFGFEARWVYLPALKKEEMGEFQRVIEEQSLFYPCFSEWEEWGRGAFSRMELRVQDGMGREWPISAVEVRHLRVDQAKEKGSFVLISQQVICSLGRLIALLIEKHEGDFPLWLAPEQVRLFVIGESSLPEAEEIVRLLRGRGVRIGLDKRSGKLNERIYEAERERVPYLLFFGEEERKKGKLRLRIRGKQVPMQGLEELIAELVPLT